jgi:hypothetical protein
MYELSPDECTLGTSGANPGRRKTAAQEARGTWTSAVTSALAATPIPSAPPEAFLAPPTFGTFH